MLRRSLFALFALQISLACAADPVDPIQEKLTKAKVSYTEVFASVQLALDDSFAKREAVARETGSKQTIDSIKADKAAFIAKGVLSNNVHTLPLVAAKKQLLAAYEECVRDYTKAGQDDKAAAVEAEATIIAKGNYLPPDVQSKAGRSARLRTEIAALKDRVARLEKELQLLEPVPKPKK